MHNSARSLAIGSVIGLSALVFGGSVAANAEVPDAVDQAIVDASLQNLGTEPVSDQLTSELVAGVDAASDAGIVDQTIIDALTEPTVEDSTVEPAPTNSSRDALPKEAEQLLDEHLDGDQELWDEIAPAWLAAFETIRTDFETCRTNGSDTSQCARTMGVSLQIAHAEAILAELDARTAEVANLPEAEQAAVLAEIEAERTAIETKLMRSQDRLAELALAGSADAAVDRAARLTAVLAKVRDRAPGANAAEKALTATDAPTQTGGTGSRSAEPSKASSTPGSTSSQAPTQKSNGGNSPSGATGNGKSAGAGKPENPGSGKPE